MMMMMMIMIIIIIIIMVLVVVLVVVVIAWEARLCNGGKRQKSGKIGSPSSPIFYFAHADFFSPFSPNAEPDPCWLWWWWWW